MISRQINDRECIVTGKTSVEVKREGRQLRAQGWIKRGPTAWSPQGDCFYQWWDRPDVDAKLSARRGRSEANKQMIKRFKKWLFGRRVCPCCQLRFHFKTDEAMWGQMLCWGCASVVKNFRKRGDERFAVHEYPE